MHVIHEQDRRGTVSPYRAGGKLGHPALDRLLIGGA
jgi:hypothetical protein